MSSPNKNYYFSYDTMRENNQQFYCKSNISFSQTEHIHYSNIENCSNYELKTNTNEDIIKYISHNETCRLITLFTNKVELDEDGYLKTNNKKYKSKIVFKKMFSLSKKQIINLIYQLYSYRNILNNNNIYSKIIEIIHNFNIIFNDFNMADVMVYLIDNLYNNETCTEFNFNIHNKNKIIVSNSFCETYDMATIYFCQSSLDFLDCQLLEKHLTSGFRKSRIMLQTIKKWMNKKLSIYEREQIMIIGGTILYTFGLRNNSDMDFYVNSIDTIDNKLSDLVEIKKRLINPNTAFQFIDVICKGTERWTDYYDNWGVEWSKLCGCKSLDDMLHDGNYHYYFMGIKFMNLPVDIERRIKRNRPNSITDLIQIKDQLYIKLDIPKIPDKRRIGKNRDEIVMDNDKKKEFINLIIKSTKIRYHLDLDYNYVKELIWF